MIDISDMSLDQLKELRDRCNARIASLTLQEKKKEDPRRYSYRTMDLYFSEEAYETMMDIRRDYSDYIKDDRWKKYPIGSWTFWIVQLFAPKEIRDQILKEYRYHRIYETYTPESKHLYKGYVIDGKEEQNESTNKI